MSGFGTAPIPRPQGEEGNRGQGIFGGRGHVLGDH